MDGMLAALKRYQLPLLIVGGAGAAYAAFTRRQAATVPASGASPILQIPASATPAMTPEQQLAAFTAGGQVAIAAFEPAASIAREGVSVAGLAATGAQAVSQAALGNLGGAVTTIGAALGDVVAALPDLSPTPAPTTPAPTTPPASPPPATTAPTFVGYEIRARGRVGYYLITSPCLLKPAAGVHSTDRDSAAPVERGTCNGRVFWRITAGGYRGRCAVAGMTTGTWSIVKVYRRADGTRYSQTIGKTSS